MKVWELEEGKEYVSETKYQLIDGDLYYMNPSINYGSYMISGMEYNRAKETNFTLYTPPIDWSKVEVDTKVLVRDWDNSEWIPRHFAIYKNEESILGTMDILRSQAEQGRLCSLQSSQTLHRINQSNQKERRYYMHYKRIAPLFLALTVSCVPLSQYVNSAELIRADDESRYTMEVSQDYHVGYKEDMQAEIDALDKSDTKQWYLEYRRITQFYSPYYPIDVEKSIHYYANDNQFDLICRVVQAEIGGGDFNAKCNVASTIFHRGEYMLRTWESVIYEKYQYTPILDGRYKKVIQ